MALQWCSPDAGRCMTRLLSWVVVLLLLGSCGPKEAGGPSVDGFTPVVAVGSQWYAHTPVWVGIERGIFERHGFSVQWRYIGKSMDRLNAISSGEAHFASLGEIAMLSAMAQGNQRFYWVGTQDMAPGFEGLVAGHGIARFNQLKGKTIGLPFGSSVELTVRMLLAQNGLDPRRDVRLVNLEVGDVPAVFRAGNVDAASIWEPGFSQLRAVPGATVLGMDTDTEVYHRFGTMTGPDVLIISRSWLEENPDTARRFMAAYFEALAWVRAHPEQAAELVQGRYIQQNLELIQEDLDKFVWYGAADQYHVMSDDGIFAQVDYILDILFEQMQAIPNKPDFRQWVNLEILPPVDIDQ
jgi:ABC-type nitrate/sulfonate/bicarbonate transport system substrate-binding protein